MYPEVDDIIDIDGNPADLRIGIYRASGAGGRVNRAIRRCVSPIFHRDCDTSQNDRSQHKTKTGHEADWLYELEMQKND